MKQRKYDIVYDEGGISMQLHFCRVWDGDEGCYGTNENHGLTFEEAKEEIIASHKKAILYWENRTEKQEMEWYKMHDNTGAKRTKRK